MEATREQVKYRYDLIPPEALAGLAVRMAEGAEKYGDHNWKKGLVGHKDPINHALSHITQYLFETAAITRGTLDDYTDDHLGAALANIAFQVYFSSRDCYDASNRLDDDMEIVDGEPVHCIKLPEPPVEIEQLPLWEDPIEALSGKGYPIADPPRAAAGDPEPEPEGKIRAALYNLFGLTA